MTTAAMISNRNSGSCVLILLIMCALIALAAVSAHAIERHGTTAITAAQCTDNPQVRLYNPTTQRIAFLCMTEQGWGVAVVDRNGFPVTSFLKEKMKTLEQVIRYMRNAGYEPIQ